MHANMINEVMNCEKSIKKNLYVGLCGTQYVGSDRYACVITEVISPKVVRVAWMHDRDYNVNRETDLLGNESISPENMGHYVRVNKEFTKLEPEGKIFKLRKNGRWIVEGESLWSTGSVSFGHADNYRDPSF